ncbi:hypothetical protein KP509_11G069000 [Ceratopteris richardii]|uniref:Lysine-specific demethylase JMJ25 n=1 Tax=Ceratopteris richardii TaxID=49495 RepID=A0A8T2TWD2_CERRI|nr:hypothetical protein KP509_11G069000 [Ceratopteris richardii]
MNRGRKGVGGNRVEEVIPDELRCKRSDGKQWRCNARAMENKTLCERHYNQAKKRAAGATTNSSPKKKKAKESASPEVLQLSRPAVDRTKVQSRGVVDRSSRVYSSGALPPDGDYRLSSDYRHANYKLSDYRPASDYRQATNFKAFNDPSISRQRMPNGSSRKFDERPRPRRSPGRDPYFKDELLHDEEMDQQIDICHQCQRTDRGELISCLQCGKRSYCSQCISRWYSGMHEDDVRQSCPHCRGNCNCKACILVDEGASIFSEVKVVNDVEKVQRLKYMLAFIKPVLQRLHSEQCEEIDLQVNLTGDENLKAERSKLMKDERLYCDNCTTSIVDLYRSCLSCGYDLCLTCCRELRQGKQPGGELASSADQSSYARLKGSANGHESRLPVWSANVDGSILCPPAERGGCGTSSLILKRILKSNWVAKLAAEVNYLTALDQKPSVLSDAQCSCKIDTDTASNLDKSHKHLRLASHRSDHQGNYLYCPSAQTAEKEGLEHFQRHWLRGEPVIVRDIFDEAQGLNWEPLVLWRALRDSTKSKSMGVLDCLDWCLVEVSINQFFKGYQEGRIHKTGWPELLKMKDPLSASLIEERLPRLGVQLIRALPYHEYTNVRHGVLNLASKIPDDCLRPDYGPKASVAYGLREELGRGDSVSKLHYDMSDTVTVLVHSTEVKLAEWQTSRLEKFKAEYKKASAGEHMHSEDVSANLHEGVFHANGVTSMKKEMAWHGVASSIKEEAARSRLGESIHDSRDSRTLLKHEAFGETCTENDKENKQPLLGQLGEMKDSNYYGGVLWEIFRRQDVPMLMAYLSRHFQEFKHTNEEVLDRVTHPIYDQTFYLTKEHKVKLKDEYGIEPWTFEQRIGEAILVPAGCPYQTRNLKSCITVTLEFASPENLQELLHLSDEFRLLPKGHAAKDDKLETFHSDGTAVTCIDSNSLLL